MVFTSCFRASSSKKIVIETSPEIETTSSVNTSKKTIIDTCPEIETTPPSDTKINTDLMSDIFSIPNFFCEDNIQSAIINKKIKLVCFLLEQKFVKEFNARTLDCAVRNADNLPIIHLLLEQKCPYTYTTLYSAIRSYSLDIVKLIYNYMVSNPNYNLTSIYEDEDYHCYVPIHHDEIIPLSCGLSGDKVYEILEWLLNQNQFEYSVHSCYYSAIKGNNIKMLEFIKHSNHFKNPLTSLTSYKKILSDVSKINCVTWKWLLDNKLVKVDDVSFKKKVVDKLSHNNEFINLIKSYGYNKLSVNP